MLRTTGTRSAIWGAVWGAVMLSVVPLVVSPLGAQAPDRSSPPELGPAPTLSLPPISERTLANGLRVIYMPKHNVPLVQVNLVVKVGSVADPDNRPGLASMVAAMLDEGAGGRSALELAEEIDFLGASIRVSGGRHFITVALHAPVSKLEPALDLLADVVLRPTFADEELDRQRRQRLTTIMQWRDEPRAIARVIYDRTLYGERHPYGRQTMGTAQSMGAMSRDDLRQFHGRYFVSNNAAVVIVGDISERDAIFHLERVFGGWEAGAVPEHRFGEARQVRRRQVILVDKPGAAQSEIRIGRIGVARSTADYYPLLVMNTILGGSFASRLNQKLREEKQYTYGARSSFAFRLMAGPFTASAAVQTEVTDSALVEFMRELNAILEDVSDEEMTRARNFVALRFPSRFQAVSQIAGALENLFEYDLQPGYFNNFVQNVLSVTKEDVLRVARQHIDPERVAIIVVGDRSVIEDGVRALNLGPVRVLSVEDVLGPPPEVSGN